MANKSILVTGSHRSGTTWVGKTLSISKNVSYIQEPFNIEQYNISPMIFPYWFYYIDENDTKYIEEFQNLLNLNYPQYEQFFNARNIKDFIKTFVYYFKYKKDKFLDKRVLIKDPIALMSAEFLYKNFDSDVVITIRHPAAFVSSLKIKNWNFNFEHFLKQERLMDDYLYEFRDQIKNFSDSEKSIIEQGILLWNCFHRIILIYKDKYPSWNFVRHEDLSINPKKEFMKLFDSLNLIYNANVEKYIVLSTGSHNPIEQTKNEFIRNSLENIKNWQQRLTKKEVDKIYRETKEISSIFYFDKDWE